MAKSQDIPPGLPSTSFAPHEREVVRDVPIDELLTSFDIDDMLAVESHQKGISDAKSLADNPLPAEFLTKYGHQAYILADNSESYDDAGEDLLFEDEIILHIVDARRSGDSAALIELFRVRRSVVTFILSNWDNIMERDQPLGQTGT